MAVDTLPFDEIFPICRKILDQELRLIHYTDLSERALKQLGLTRRDVNWQRQIEDIREKMLSAGQHDTFYIGKPYCLAGVRWWFESDQLRLFNPTLGIIIPGNATAGANGAFEALMRDPYMKIKTSAPIERISRGRANGFVLEKHVAHWFQVKWPRFYQPPDNEGQWTKPCDHDFKLNIKGNVAKVDVTGPRLNGYYGNPGQGKHSTHFHLLCEIVGQDVMWRSVYKGQDYQTSISPEGQIFGGIWPERMAVWLNCHQDGLDYLAIKSAVRTNSHTYASAA